MVFLRRIIATAVVPLLVVCACAGAGCRGDLAPPDARDDAPADEAINAVAPAWNDAANASYTGIRQDSIKLRSGVWQAAAGSPDRVSLMPYFHVTGDLDGDGTDNAAVILRSTGTATGDYLAVLRRHGKNASDVGTAALDNGIQIRSGRIANLTILLDVVRGGPNDAACCPTQNARLAFKLRRNALTKIGDEVTGAASIADMAGSGWRLTSFGAGEAVPETPPMTLRLDGDRLSGQGACNQFSTSVATAGGQMISVQPIASTRMSCQEPGDALERRYFLALEHASRFSFDAGQLRLHYTGDGVNRELTFRPQ